MNTTMDHIVLNVADEEKIIQFYSKVLLMKPERLDAYRAGKVPFPSVRMNPVTIISLFPKKLWQSDGSAEKGHVNMNHFCVVLDKKPWHDLLKRLEEKGIPIEEGPVPRWGAQGMGTAIYFRDPEDNLIEARYYENAR